MIDNGAADGRDPSGTVLFVDDDEDARLMVREGLTRLGYRVETAESAERALEIISDTVLDVVITDVCMDGMDGIALCRRIFAIDRSLPVVITTGVGDADTVLEAMRAHADDFVTKPLSLAHLQAVIERAIAAQPVRLIGDAPISAERLALLSLDPELSRALAAARDVDAEESTVLITGESGTGVDLVARELYLAGRDTGELVVVRCATLPPDELRARLFEPAGPAVRQLAALDRTYFLDDVGELEPAEQRLLLEALEARDEDAPGRVIAASQRDLRAAISDGSFREDLYFRLCRSAITLTPLRERRGDILPLSRQLIGRISDTLGKTMNGISFPVAQALLEYPWPCNIRELENTLARAVRLSRFAQLRLDDLPIRIRGCGQVSRAGARMMAGARDA